MVTKKGGYEYKKLDGEPENEGNKKVLKYSSTLDDNGNIIYKNHKGIDIESNLIAKEIIPHIIFEYDRYFPENPNYIKYYSNIKIKYYESINECIDIRKSIIFARCRGVDWNDKTMIDYIDELNIFVNYSYIYYDVFMRAKQKYSEELSLSKKKFDQKVNSMIEKMGVVLKYKIRFKCSGEDVYISYSEKLNRLAIPDWYYDNDLLQGNEEEDDSSDQVKDNISVSVKIPVSEPVSKSDKNDITKNVYYTPCEKFLKIIKNPDNGRVYEKSTFYLARLLFSLGITTTASYRKFAINTHPDKVNNDTLRECMIYVNEIVVELKSRNMWNDTVLKLGSVVK